MFINTKRNIVYLCVTSRDSPQGEFSTSQMLQTLSPPLLTTGGRVYLSVQTYKAFLCFHHFYPRVVGGMAGYPDRKSYIELKIQFVYRYWWHKKKKTQHVRYIHLIKFILKTVNFLTGLVVVMYNHLRESIKCSD